LLIVNRSEEYDILIDPIPGVREISVPPDWTEGQMWNEAMNHIDTPWVAGWDETSWHHPHRLTFQMASRLPNHATILRSSLVVDLPGNRVGVVNDDISCAGCMLFPKPDEEKPFTATRPTEDSDFFLRQFGYHGKYTIVENSDQQWPGPTMYVRFWHSEQYSPESVQRLLPKMDESAVTADQSDRLRDIMPDFYSIIVGVTSDEAING